MNMMSRIINCVNRPDFSVSLEKYPIPANVDIVKVDGENLERPVSMSEFLESTAAKTSQGGGIVEGPDGWEYISLGLDTSIIEEITDQIIYNVLEDYGNPEETGLRVSGVLANGYSFDVSLDPRDYCDCDGNYVKATGDEDEDPVFESDNPILDTFLEIQKKLLEFSEYAKNLTWFWIKPIGEPVLVLLFEKN